ncbi:hypothetical protein QQF64_006748 [Cirrhinus molitorella]|uniref:Uncharacterized protein n=1 Tax=Cirrhinus molitorella TaxID=172907 RepID=A0ABR3MCS9_9TELE
MYCTAFLLSARPLLQYVNSKSSLGTQTYCILRVCAPVEKSDGLALKQKSPVLCEFISAGQDLRGALVLASEEHSMCHVCDPSASATLNKLANHAIKQTLVH